MSRRRKKVIAVAATLAAAVLQNSQDEAARALAQLVLDLQPWPAPRALRRRAYTELRRLKAQLKDLAESATAVSEIATGLMGTVEQVDALLTHTAAAQAAVPEEERRISEQRAMLAGWALPLGATRMRSKRLRLVARHIRACARHVAYNLRCVAAALYYGEIREVRPLFPSCEEPDPDEERVTHPSYLCRCVCGREAPRVEHAADCPWAAQMCRTCEGPGLCPGCLGDGTEPDHPPVPPKTRACA